MYIYILQCHAHPPYPPPPWSHLISLAHFMVACSVQAVVTRGERVWREMSARSGAPRAPPALLQLMGRLLVGRAQEAHRHLQPQVAKARAKTKERRDAVLTDERKDRCRIKVPMCNPTRMPWCGRSCAPSTFFGIFFLKKTQKIRRGGVFLFRWRGDQGASHAVWLASRRLPTPHWDHPSWVPFATRMQHMGSRDSAAKHTQPW